MYEAVRAARNFFGLGGLGPCALAANEKESLENVYGKGRESPASPNTTADQERKYRWRSSARRARRESLSDVESKAAAPRRKSRTQLGSPSRHRTTARDQGLQH